MCKFLFFPLILFFAKTGFANPVIQDALENPEMIGGGEYRAMFWKIYDAELYADHGEYTRGNPFALRLIYSRDIAGDAIADKSIELIRRQGIDDEVMLAAWHRQLHNIFPDVEEATEIIGIHEVDVGARFYADGELIGSVDDPRLCQAFFGIWLSEDTISPKLRAELLGLASN